MSDYFPCSPSASQTPRKVEVNRLVMMWYVPLLFMPLSVYFHTFSGTAYLWCSVIYPFFCKWKYLLPWPVGFWRKKWLQSPLLLSQAWKRSPLVVVWLRRLGSQCRVSRLLRILRLPKIPSPSRLSVPARLCHLNLFQAKNPWGRVSIHTSRWAPIYPL